MRDVNKFFEDGKWTDKWELLSRAEKTETYPARMGGEWGKATKEQLIPQKDSRNAQELEALSTPDSQG